MKVTSGSLRNISRSARLRYRGCDAYSYIINNAFFLRFFINFNFFLVFNYFFIYNFPDQFIASYFLRIIYPNLSELPDPKKNGFIIYKTQFPEIF